jgi:hypothetical protein
MALQAADGLIVIATFFFPDCSQARFLALQAADGPKHENLHREGPIPEIVLVLVLEF